MHQFVTIVVVLAVAAVLLLPLARTIEPWLSTVERGLTFLATALILFVMAFVCAEVLMRYAFNSPIPGHLESSELIMPVIVFFGLSYTQSVRGHVGMTLVEDALSPQARRRLEATTMVLSLFIYAVLTWYSAEQALRSWTYDDVTMTPPYFKIWPSSAAVPLGFAVCTLRLYLQVLKRLWPSRFWFDDKHAPGMGMEE